MIRCDFCRRAVPDEDAAILDDWIPGYWVGAEEFYRPVCAGCCRVYLRFGADGEAELVEKGKAPSTFAREQERDYESDMIPW